jgi:hypothetical protein
VAGLTAQPTLAQALSESGQDRIMLHSDDGGQVQGGSQRGRTSLGNMGVAAFATRLTLLGVEASEGHQLPHIAKMTDIGNFSQQPARRQLTQTENAGYGHRQAAGERLRRTGEKKALFIQTREQY